MLRIAVREPKVRTDRPMSAIDISHHEANAGHRKDQVLRRDLATVGLGCVRRKGKARERNDSRAHQNTALSLKEEHASGRESTKRSGRPSGRRIVGPADRLIVLT